MPAVRAGQCGRDVPFDLFTADPQWVIAGAGLALVLGKPLGVFVGSRLMVDGSPELLPAAGRHVMGGIIFIA